MLAETNSPLNRDKFLRMLFDDGQQTCFSSNPYNTDLKQKPEANDVYFSINAMHTSRADAHVICYRNFLLEIDSVPLEKQIALVTSKLPVTAITFSGDKPSSKNLDKSIAFVGTQSYKRLLRILQLAGLEEFVLCNAFGADDTPQPIPVGGKYVALGKNAAKRLTALGLPHLALPHPSGRNRQWNKPDAEQEIADELKKFLETL